MTELTQSELKKHLHYDPETGVFTRLICSAFRIKIGDIAGYKQKNGYLRIMILGKNYLAHRLAWLYMYGEFSINDNRHINGNLSDNSICNLQSIDRSANKGKSIHKRNTSGYKGVTWHKHVQKWSAQCGLNRKLIPLGYFDTPEEASLAYQKFAKENHGESYKS